MKEKNHSLGRLPILVAEAGGVSSVDMCGQLFCPLRRLKRWRALNNCNSLALCLWRLQQVTAVAAQLRLPRVDDHRRRRQRLGRRGRVGRVLAGRPRLGRRLVRRRLRVGVRRAAVRRCGAQVRHLDGKRDVA